MNSENLAHNIRLDALEMIHKSHASHIGAILSVTDIVSVLYSDILKVFPNDPRSPERDRVILSKGHAGAVLYAALAECGFFPIGNLDNYYQNGSLYSGHVSRDVPGVDLSTGSLGHGVCVACGMALSAHVRNESHNVYAIVGDGECEEGSVWEMAAFANRYKLDNLTVIVDNNGMQAMGTCENVLDFIDLESKWAAFGWNVIPVKDGNDHNQLRNAFNSRLSGKPNVIIAHTVKGKGVSFMENNLLWHYKDPQDEFYERAKEELGNRL